MKQTSQPIKFFPYIYFILICLNDITGTEIVEYRSNMFSIFDEGENYILNEFEDKFHRAIEERFKKYPSQSLIHRQINSQYQLTTILTLNTEENLFNEQFVVFLFNLQNGELLWASFFSTENIHPNVRELSEIQNIFMTKEEKKILNSEFQDDQIYSELMKSLNNEYVIQNTSFNQIISNSQDNQFMILNNGTIKLKFIKRNIIIKNVQQQIQFQLHLQKYGKVSLQDAFERRFQILSKISDKNTKKLQNRILQIEQQLNKKNIEHFQNKTNEIQNLTKTISQITQNYEYVCLILQIIICAFILFVFCACIKCCRR